jgi:hypothetical protein
VEAIKEPLGAVSEGAFEEHHRKSQNSFATFFAMQAKALGSAIGMGLFCSALGDLINQHALSPKRAPPPPPTPTTPTTPTPQQPPLELSFFGFSPDLQRTCRMAFVSGFLITPINQYYNITVERIFPGRAARAMTQKMLSNSFVIAPISIGLSFCANGLLQGEEVDKIRDRINQNALKTWGAGFFFWPPVGFLILRFAPAHYRAHFGSMASVVWQLFMSEMLNGPVTSESEKNGKAEQ